MIQDYETCVFMILNLMQRINITTKTLSKFNLI